MDNITLSTHELFKRLISADKAVSSEHKKKLNESWKDPEGFWNSYWDEHKSYRHFKSHIWQSYDFYHDAVIRHCLDDDDIQQMEQATMTYEQELFPTFFASPQGKASIQAKLAQYKAQGVFCAIDTESLLQDATWREFLLLLLID